MPVLGRSCARERLDESGGLTGDRRKGLDRNELKGGPLGTSSGMRVGVEGGMSSNSRPYDTSRMYRSASHAFPDEEPALPPIPPARGAEDAATVAAATVGPAAEAAAGNESSS
jgi:hypothetical protein